MRSVHVFPSWQHLERQDVASRDVVIVDVLRATTTIAVAVARGAEVIPAASVGEAKKLARRVEDTLLAGERDGLPIAGFDAGNSPGDMARIVTLMRRRVVLTTTNGTRAVQACADAGAARIFAGALVNAPALGRALRGARRDLAIVCAGRASGRMAIEDVAGAGALVAALGGAASLADSARIAQDVFVRHRRTLGALLRTCEGGRYLISIGYGRDLRRCASHGALRVVPMLVRGAFREI